MDKCSNCRGTGEHQTLEHKPCLICGGTGKTPKPSKLERVQKICAQANYDNHRYPDATSILMALHDVIYEDCKDCARKRRLCPKHQSKTPPVKEPECVPCGGDPKWKESCLCPCHKEPKEEPKCTCTNAHKESSQECPKHGKLYTLDEVFEEPNSPELEELREIIYGTGDYYGIDKREEKIESLLIWHQESLESFCKELKEAGYSGCTKHSVIDTCLERYRGQ